MGYTGSHHAEALEMFQRLTCQTYTMKIAVGEFREAEAFSLAKNTSGCRLMLDNNAFRLSSTSRGENNVGCLTNRREYTVVARLRSGNAFEQSIVNRDSLMYQLCIGFEVGFLSQNEVRLSLLENAQYPLIRFACAYWEKSASCFEHAKGGNHSPS